LQVKKPEMRSLSHSAFDWEGEVKGVLKAELARRGMKYPDLVRNLAEVGVTESAPNLRNKISRGNFSAVFLWQCLMALGVTDLRIGRYPGDDLIRQTQALKDNSL